MYHAKNGLYFERLDNGNIRIVKTSDDKVLTNDNILYDNIIDMHMWASIVAHSSIDGESTSKYYDAIKFISTPKREVL